MAQGAHRAHVERSGLHREAWSHPLYPIGAWPDEAFFSIDEFGPFAVKDETRPQLVPPGTRSVPQWQKSEAA